MKVAQQADTLTLYGAVESLQRIAQNAPSHEAMRQQAEAEGFDPDFVDEVMKRVRGEANKNFVQRRVSTKEISEAVLGLLYELDEVDGVPRQMAGSRAMVWHQTKEALKDFGKTLGISFADLDSAIDELDGLYFPGALTNLGTAMTAMWRIEVERRLDFQPNLTKLAEELTTWLKQTAGLDERQLRVRLQLVANEESAKSPWKLELAKAWCKTEKGKRGEDPTAEDLAEMFLNLGLLEELMRDIEDGPWWALHTQAQVMRSHQNVGDALQQLALLMQ